MSDDTLPIPNFLRNQTNLIAEKDARILELQAQIDRMRHCNICGGMVDLKNATKPTAKIGVGRPLGSKNDGGTEHG